MPRVIPRLRVGVGIVSALLALLSPPAHAQQEAAPILLQLRPRVGDTLRTRLDQQTEVTMTLAQPAGAANSTRSSTTRVVIASRTIVRSALSLSTTVLTVVDSASFTSTDAQAAALVAQAERAVEGQQLLLQLASDGSVESALDARTGRASRDAGAMATMPAVFPRKPVWVGDNWTREMPLPAVGPLGARSGGRVKAMFRLDSLQRGGRIAYVSMHGEIVPDAGPAGVEVSGTISGAMQLDRERGWLTDSRIMVLMRSALRAPAAAGTVPMRFVTRVTQRLRTMDKR